MSPIGSRLAVLFRTDQRGGVAVFDTQDGQLIALRDFRVAPAPPFALASDCSKLLANATFEQTNCGSDDAWFAEFDLSTGEIVRLPGPGSGEWGQPVAASYDKSDRPIFATLLQAGGDRRKRFAFDSSGRFVSLQGDDASPGGPTSDSCLYEWDSFIAVHTLDAEGIVRRAGAWPCQGERRSMWMRPTFRVLGLSPDGCVMFVNDTTLMGASTAGGLRMLMPPPHREGDRWFTAAGSIGRFFLARSAAVSRGKLPARSTAVREEWLEACNAGGGVPTAAARTGGRLLDAATSLDGSVVASLAFPFIGADPNPAVTVHFLTGSARDVAIDIAALGIGLTARRNSMPRLELLGRLKALIANGRVADFDCVMAAFGFRRPSTTEAEDTEAEDEDAEFTWGGGSARYGLYGGGAQLELDLDNGPCLDQASIEKAFGRAETAEGGDICDYSPPEVPGNPNVTLSYRWANGVSANFEMWHDYGAHTVTLSQVGSQPC